MGQKAGGATRGGTPPVHVDSWLDGLAKLVPGEMIVAFTLATRVPGVTQTASAHLVILIAFAALVPLLLRSSAKRAGVAAPFLQYTVRTLAFLLYGSGTDAVLMSSLDKLTWILQLGAMVVAALAALILSPPGIQRPPSVAVRKSRR
jgi:hypothetical protein